MKRIVFLVKYIIVSSIRCFYAFISNGTSCIICNNQAFLVPLCRNCLRQYFDVEKAVSSKRCKCCGKELISTVNTCIKCREETVLKHTDKVMPLFSYRLWNKELLFKWKIKGERTLSPFFAKLVFQALKKMGEEVVVPVPPRKGKIQKNGWDQIDELCGILEYRYGFKVLKLLERNSIEQQKKLNRKERLDTIKSAYSLKKRVTVIPERVCLLDDVSTTGSTIECCAKILKEAGVRTVNVITLFTVD